MLLNFKKRKVNWSFIGIIVIPFSIMTLAVINAETLEEKEGRYFSCLERYDEQKCRVILK